MPTIDLSTIQPSYDITALIFLLLVVGLAFLAMMRSIIRSQSKDRADQAHLISNALELFAPLPTGIASNTSALTILTARLTQYLDAQLAHDGRMTADLIAIRDDSNALKMAMAALSEGDAAQRVRIDEIATTATSALDHLRAELNEVKTLVQAGSADTKVRHAQLEHVVNNTLVLVQSIRNDLAVVISNLTKPITEESATNA
jgi:hypothetical protein